MFVRPTSHSSALGPGCAGPSLAHYTPDKLDASTGPSLQQPLAGGAPFMVDAHAAAASHAGSDPRKHTTYVQPLVRSLCTGQVIASLSTHGFPAVMQSNQHVRLWRSTPYVTGTSVLGITYKDGVLIAADTLGKSFSGATTSLCAGGSFNLARHARGRPPVVALLRVGTQGD